MPMMTWMRGKRIPILGAARIIHPLAGRVTWSSDGTKIYFDKIDGATYFDIWSMTNTGGTIVNLTGSKPPPFTTKHIGQPATSPDGAWIAYQAMQDASADDAGGTPGAGVRNDMYIMPVDASTTTKVVDVGAGGGLLHPHWNAAGTRLVWGQYVGAGSSALGHWALKRGNFSAPGGVPTLGSIVTFDPGAVPDWLEIHGFHPLSEDFVLVSGNPDGQNVLRSDIYFFQLSTQTLTNLTNDNQWEEHAHINPTGTHIIFMRGTTDDEPLATLLTEFWIMNSDGSNKRQLTFFNTPGHKMFQGATWLAADGEWSPDGTKYACLLQLSGTNQGRIYVFDINTGSLL